MTGPPAPSWITGRPPNRLAALPTGRLGRLGGMLMRIGNAGQQRELCALLDPPIGDVLELGSGPGVLLGLLAGRTDVGRLVGVDPSFQMRRLAVRSLAGQIAAGRVEIRPGDATAIGLPDAAFDLVVSVNTVAIWPDLEAGVAELRRVLRPTGRLLLSWHGGHRPTKAGRRMQLSEVQWKRIESAVAARFDRVSRGRTRRCTVLDARV